MAMTFIQPGSNAYKNLEVSYQPTWVQEPDVEDKPKMIPVTMEIDELLKRCDYILRYKSDTRPQLAELAEKRVNYYGINTSENFKCLIEALSATSKKGMCFSIQELESALYGLSYQHNSEALLLMEIVKSFTPDFFRDYDWKDIYADDFDISKISSNNKAWDNYTRYNFYMVQIQSQFNDDSLESRVKETVDMFLAKPKEYRLTKEDKWALDRVLGFLGHLDNAGLAEYGVTSRQVRSLKTMALRYTFNENPYIGDPWIDSSGPDDGIDDSNTD